MGVGVTIYYGRIYGHPRYGNDEIWQIIETFYGNPTIIASPPQNIQRLVKVPSLDEDFEVDAGVLELPLKTTEALENFSIVTLKQRLWLIHDVKQKRLRIDSESLPVNMDLPDPYNKLKDRPSFHSHYDDIEFILPDSVKLKNYKNIDVIPIEIRVKEIKGTIGWK